MFKKQAPGRKVISQKSKWANSDADFCDLMNARDLEHTTWNTTSESKEKKSVFHVNHAIWRENSEESQMIFFRFRFSHV